MPSPLAHGAIAWWLHRRAGLRHRPADATSADGRDSAWLGLAGFLVVWGLSVLPDFDFALGLWLGDTAGWHNGPSHSLAAGVLVAVVVGPLARYSVGRRLGGSLGRWIGLSLAAYWGHVLLDGLTQGRGVKWFWPWFHDRLAPPFAPFYGVRWSDGVIDERLVWTLVNELAFVVLVVSLTLALARNKTGEAESASPVE